MAYLLSGSWPPGSNMYGFSFYGVGLPFNQRVLAYSHNIYVPSVPTYIAGVSPLQIVELVAGLIATFLFC